MARQHKVVRFQVKAIDDEKGTIEAYGSVFDVPDYGDDIVRRGAFKRTIQHAKSRIESGKSRFLAVMLYQHDADRPIGGWTDLEEDENGLKCKGRIILDTQLGRETYALIKERVIDQFSIGYDVPSGGSTYDKSSGYRELKELRLWEISPVTFAMQPEALLTGVKKNMPKKDFNERYQENCAADVLGNDWYGLKEALYSALCDAFISAQPEQDAASALEQFRAACMQWFADGLTSGVPDYLQDRQAANSLYGGYMSSNRELSAKAGRSISAANSDKIQNHVDNLHAMADKMLSSMKEHQKAIHSAADDLATVLQGSEAAYGTDAGTPDAGQQGKSASSRIETRAAAPHPSFEDTADEQELATLLDVLRSANNSSK